MNGQKDSWLRLVSQASGKLRKEAEKICRLKKGSRSTSIMPTRITSCTISGSWPIHLPHLSRKQTPKKILFCNFPLQGNCFFIYTSKKKLPVCQRTTSLSYP